MKTSIYFLLLVGTIAQSSHVFAGVSSGSFSIARVGVTNSFFTVYSASGEVTHEGCDNGDKVVFLRTDYPDGYDSMLSVVLAAYMGNKRVFMWFNGCKTGPWGLTLPFASSIVVRDN